MAQCLSSTATITALLLGVGPLPLSPLNAAPVRTEKAACNRVKTYVSAVEHFPVSAIALCDITEGAVGPRGFYVMALHSNRHCDGICSTNMGWFAVEKRTGHVFKWNAADMKLGALLKAHR